MNNFGVCSSIDDVKQYFVERYGKLPTKVKRWQSFRDLSIAAAPNNFGDLYNQFDRTWQTSQIFPNYGRPIYLGSLNLRLDNGGGLNQDEYALFVGVDTVSGPVEFTAGGWGSQEMPVMKYGSATYVPPAGKPVPTDWDSYTKENHFQNFLGGWIHVTYFTDATGRISARLFYNFEGFQIWFN